jgi:hypothetical protein
MITLAIAQLDSKEKTAKSTLMSAQPNHARTAEDAMMA